MVIGHWTLLKRNKKGGQGKPCTGNLSGYKQTKEQVHQQQVLYKDIHSSTIMAGLSKTKLN